MKFKILIERRIPKFRFLYLVTGVFLLVLGVLMSYVGAQYILWPVAMLCFSLMIYPTLLTWMISVVLFMIVAVWHSIMLIKELMLLDAENKVAYMLRDAPIVFPSFVLLSILVTIGVMMAKPKTIQNA